MAKVCIANFRKNLRRSLKEQGLSLRVAADLTGISYAYLHRILSSKASPSVDVCEQIADALEFELSDMLRENSEIRA